jgi:hypothetical protein
MTTGIRRLFSSNAILDAAAPIVQNPPILRHYPFHQIRKFFYGHNSRSEEKLQERLSLLKEAKALTDVAAVIEPAVLRSKC